MLIRLTGVYNDGSAYGPGVPRNPAKQVEIPWQSSATIRLTMVTPSGALRPLKVGETVALAVKQSSHQIGKQPGFTLLGAAPVPAVPGVAEFSITPNTTKPLQPGRYVFDVWITGPTGTRERLIPLSPFVLGPSVGLP